VPECFHHAVLVGEEPFLVPSHEVFFTGCNLRCHYCSVSSSMGAPGSHQTVSPARLSAWHRQAAAAGCDHVNLIGGEPTVNLPGILALLRTLPPDAAVVWNTNMMASDAAMKLLGGVVDLFLGDCRAGNRRCAARLCVWPDIPAVAFRNARIARQQASLVLRHLLVPGHVRCCFEPIARRASTALPDVAFHLMLQYTPHGRAAGMPELDRALTTDECAEAHDIAQHHRLRLTVDPGLSWRAAMPSHPGGDQPFETEIAILPTGQVSILHLSADLAEFADALSAPGGGGDSV
jgi:putative pyruvate formate lyase activating enzyme